jgi:hypothetical protein
MKESMAHAGLKQGDMSPKVKDYQKPMKDYSQRDANKTTEYVERQDREQGKDAKQLDKQAWKGRYS